MPNTASIRLLSSSARKLSNSNTTVRHRYRLRPRTTSSSSSSSERFSFATTSTKSVHNATLVTSRSPAISSTITTTTNRWNDLLLRLGTTSSRLGGWPSHPHHYQRYRAVDVRSKSTAISRRWNTNKTAKVEQQQQQQREQCNGTTTPLLSTIKAVASSGSIRNDGDDDKNDNHERLSYRWPRDGGVAPCHQSHPHQHSHSHSHGMEKERLTTEEEEAFREYLIGVIVDEALESFQNRYQNKHQNRSRWKQQRRHSNENFFSRRRSFTTKVDGGEDDSGINGGKSIGTKDIASKGDHEQQQTDPEFAEYLNGKIDIIDGIDLPPVQVQTISKPTLLDDDETSSSKPGLDSSSSSTNNTNTNDPTSQSARSFEWFNTLLTDKPQLHHQTPTPPPTTKAFHKKTHTNQEKLRAQRTVTVRRALVGNLFITAIKLAAFLHSGSSAIKAEFVHSVVDCGNQSLLLLGLRELGNKADRAHPYGYGKSIYFWALVSALGTFFLGAGVSMTQAIPELIYGPSLHEITWHVWGVLGVSFAVDGYVITKTLFEVKDSMPSNPNNTPPSTSSFLNHLYRIRDPAILAILLEDSAACVGILMATTGLALTHAFDMPVFDAMAGVGISGLLAAMGVILVRVNHRFLLGQAVDYDIIRGIEKILTDRISIDHVHSVQSQWTGPETFSYKAEVDFDGTFLAAKLMPRYQQEFAEARATLDQDLRVLLSWYAEDVMRTVEREVRHIEADIRKQYPGAQFIELEPMSKDADRYAIDDGMEAQLKRIETEALNRYLKRLYQDRK